MNAHARKLLPECISEPLQFCQQIVHTAKTVYGPELASLTDTVALLYTKEKVKHSVRKVS